MEGRKSPVLRSVKCSYQSKQKHKYDSDSFCDSLFPSEVSSASKCSTQESIRTTQNSQPFKARLEKKFMETFDLSLNKNENKESEADVSLEPFSLSFVDLGPFFGLPSNVRSQIYLNRKIQKLYEWQESCLEMGVRGKNLLFSLPTSSGKTLVAEILMLRKLLLYHKDAIFVLPYISLVQEKVRGLSSLAVDLNFVVEEYASSKGYYPPKKRKKRNTIYVATIEKANSLIESLLETNRISEIGIVVIDEIHMISEFGGRGARLEAMITKLKHFSGNVQLVSMSATVGNLDVLATFLNACLFERGFRPVPLTQFMKVEDDIAIINSKALSEEDLFENCPAKSSCQVESKLDPDGLTQLVEEVIPKYSCLLFCRSRANCEAVAKMLSSGFPRTLLQTEKPAKIGLLSALKEEGGGELCPVLRKTVPFGVAYHHSGLTDGERKLLEEAFLMGTLCCIVCTSTLAAGVNLPARRVIIRAPYLGKDFITKSRYDQMIGRAGRAGLDELGESFVIVDPRDVAKMKELLLSPTENCYSRMTEEESKGLTHLLFSMIGLQMIKSVASGLELVQDTLLYLQAQVLGIDVQNEVMKVLEKLRYQGLLRSQRDSKPKKGIDASAAEGLSKLKDASLTCVSKLQLEDDLIVCRVGKAAVKGSVDLRWANRLYCDLVKSRRSLAVHSHLHLLYLVIPYDTSDNFVCNPETFYSLFTKLNEEEAEVAFLLGVTNARAVKISMGIHPKDLDKLVLHRFYVALLLHKLLSGQSIWEVSNTFGVHRGLIQHLFTASVSFAHSVLYFCEELQELWAFKDLLSSFTKTLSLCSYSEVNDLLSLPAVKIGRAKLMYKAGFRSLAEIAKATPEQLSTKIDHLPDKIAKQIISSAKMLLIERANALQEEAEDMLLNLTSDKPVQ